MKRSNSGSSLMAVLVLISTMSLLIAAVFLMTTGEARYMKRSVDRDTAIAYADGVLESLFDQWRTAMSSGALLTGTQAAKGLTGAQLTGTGTFGFCHCRPRVPPRSRFPPTNMSLSVGASMQPLPTGSLSAAAAALRWRTAPTPSCSSACITSPRPPLHFPMAPSPYSAHSRAQGRIFSITSSSAPSQSPNSTPARPCP